LEFNVPFQHKYGYIRDEGETCDALSRSAGELDRKYKYGGFSVSVKIRKI